MVSVQTCPTDRLLRPQVGRTRRFQGFSLHSPSIEDRSRHIHVSAAMVIATEAAANGGVDDDMIVLLMVLLMLLLLLSLLSLLVEVAALV